MSGEVAATPPRVSIVIPTRDRRSELRRTLQELDRQRSADWEIIVVANGCTDGTGAMVRTEYSWARLVELPENIGMPGTNAGFQAARASVLMALDDDAVPRPGTVARALAAFAADPGLHVLACAVVENGNVVNGHWGPMTPGFIGCGAFFRASTLRELDGYSPEVPGPGNEKEFACRLLSRGHLVRFDRGCEVDHRRSVIHRSWRAGAYLHARDGAYRVYRYYPAWCAPFGLAAHAVYHFSRGRKEGGWRWRDLLVFGRGLIDGARKAAGRRSVVRLPYRLAAGRAWREQMARRSRAAGLLARLAPPDFWW